MPGGSERAQRHPPEVDLVAVIETARRIFESGRQRRDDLRAQCDEFENLADRVT